MFYLPLKNTHPARLQTRPQAGSVLVLILIAVALFAALSYVVSRSSRTPSLTLSAIHADLYAAELLSYAVSVKQGIQRLRIRGCAEDAFDFTNPVWVRGNGEEVQTVNAAAPSDGSCALFGPAGGAIAQQVSEKIILIPNSTLAATTIAPRSYSITRLPIPGIGTSADDVVLMLGFVRPEVCRRINEKMGVPFVNNNTPSHAFTARTYSGIWTPVASFTDSNNVLIGQRTFCARSTLTSASPSVLRSMFYYVLMER